MTHISYNTITIPRLILINFYFFKGFVAFNYAINPANLAKSINIPIFSKLYYTARFIRNLISIPAPPLGGDIIYFKI